MPRSRAVAAIFMLLALSLAARSLAYLSIHGPAVDHITVRDEGYVFQAFFLAEPLLEDGYSTFLLAYTFTADERVVAEAYLRSQRIFSGNISCSPCIIEAKLQPPQSQGLLNVSMRPLGDQGPIVESALNLYLDVIYRNGTSRRENISRPLLLDTLSSTGSVPTSISLGAASSIMLVILFPVAAYLAYMERRRSLGIMLVAIIVLLLVEAWSLGPGLKPHGGKESMALRYVWSLNTTSGMLGGVTYVWFNGGKARHLSISLDNLAEAFLGPRDGCPTPLCIESNASMVEAEGIILHKAGETKYYYHNALRKAVLYEDGGEAIYDAEGHLFRLITVRSGKTMYYVLNASLGYDPPIAPSYYTLMFAVPPAASAAVSGALLWRSRRGGRHAQGRGGR